MEPTEGAGPFDDPDYRFEPWWPGSRIIAVVEGGQLRLEARDLTEPLASFPELRAIRGLIRGGAAVLDGTLLVLDGDGRPDAELLRERLAYPEVRDGTAAMVVSDILWARGQDVRRRPFRARLESLGGVLQETDWCMVGRGFEGEGRAVARALESMGLAAMGARHLGAPYRAGPSRGAWLRLPLQPSVPDPDHRPTLALLQRLGL